jgi:O-antigen/teichoic acid export membrane protein
LLARFLKDSAIYGAAGMLTRGIMLLLIPLYTRALAPEGFGVIDLLTVFGAIISLTVALEISQGVARFFLDTDSKDERRTYASTALWFTVGAYSVFVLAAVAFATPLARIVIGTAGWEPVFRLAAAAIALNGVYYLFQNQLRWQLQPLHYGLASVVYVVATGTVSVVLVYGLRLGVIGIYYGQIAGAVLGSGVAWWFARSSYAWRFSIERCAEMLQFSLPLVPSSIAVFLSMYVDRICIREMLTLDDLGVYGIAFRFASVMSLLLLGFQGSLMPLVYQHHAQPSTPRDLSRIFRGFLLLAVPAVAGVSLFAREIVTLFTTPAYAAAAMVIPPLAGAALLSNMYIFAPGAAIAKRTGLIAAVNVGAAVINLGLNLLLIPRMGISGAALATLVSAAAGFSAYMAIGQRLYPVPHSWQMVGGAAAVGAAMLILPHVMSLVGHGHPGLPVRATIFVLAASCAGLILLGPDGALRVGRRFAERFQYSRAR